MPRTSRPRKPRAITKGYSGSLRADSHTIIHTEPATGERRLECSSAISFTVVGGWLTPTEFLVDLGRLEKWCHRTQEYVEWLEAQVRSKSRKPREPGPYIVDGEPALRIDGQDAVGMPLQIGGSWFTLKQGRRIYEKLGRAVTWLEAQENG